MRTGLPVALVAAALAVAPVASADTAQETALAKRYAPIVRLVADTGDCGPGKPYTPIDVDVLFSEPTVALRGPWGSGDLVKIAPTAKDLSHGLYEYHLDFPGNALNPGCSYLRWERMLTAAHMPAVYAHVGTERDHPGKLALQYWLFYVFNDWNNLHEGDWEMIQLVFDASTPGQALERPPSEVGYSQHEGGERAAWDAEKLERVDGTHPVVHPAAGSHANFYGESLYLGSSAAEGVGCDDTRGPTIDVHPVVRTIPSNPAQARASFPWIAFRGRWGELRPAFFNGPTGPNLKTQWTEPIRWRRAALRRAADRHRRRLPARELALPHTDCHLARGSLGADRTGRRLGSRLDVRRASQERSARQGSVAEGHIAHRPRRGTGSSRRAARRSPADPRDERTVLARQRRCRDRLCRDHAVRRHHDDIRVFRRESSNRARRGPGAA
jgi:hypothetical protein